MNEKEKKPNKAHLHTQKKHSKNTIIKSATLYY